MSLESEFAAISSSIATWENLHRSIPCAPRFTPSMWVQLLKPPTTYSFDQAWLLCQCAEDQWLAWVPDYGEVWLTTDEFCSLTED
ncbi:hypothetical protein [Leptolyngbya sp. FACHB-17]|uniref:hypothetical protein n=1 Tax=unclassified Leptolyngbya TaxID=2650499 RepID=UPI00168096E1|nr:hypothetical protein [Leptolyngbya sp. FACHB-17]MBD2080070.1 hypothetical protein [Leptolyngbya sp. FACHB-17]